MFTGEKLIDETLGRDIKVENSKVDKSLGQYGQQKLTWSFRATQLLDKKVDKNSLGHLGQQKL